MSQPKVSNPLEFSFFAEVNNEGNIINWPVESNDVMLEVGAPNLQVTISKDWPKYKRVFHTDRPSDVLFNNIVMGTPILMNGVFVKHWVLVPFSPIEIEIYIRNAKAEVNTAINQARLDANNSFFIHKGKQVACDALSRSDIDGMNGIVQITKELPPGWIGYWKAIDNTRLPITNYTEWVAFYSSMYMQGMKHFGHAQYLKGMLDSARSLEEVQAISWSTKTPYMN